METRELVMFDGVFYVLSMLLWYIGDKYGAVLGSSL